MKGELACAEKACVDEATGSQVDVRGVFEEGSAGEGVLQMCLVGGQEVGV